MSALVDPIPNGFHTVTPYLAVKGGVAALDFYQRAFGAQERFRLMGPGGSVAHAEITIGDSIVMLADEPSSASGAPGGAGGFKVSIVLYVEEVDALFKRAIEAGAKETRPVQNQFYGDRTGSVSDPFGHQWHLMTHIEDVSPKEMDERMKALYPTAKSTPAA